MTKFIDEKINKEKKKKIGFECDKIREVGPHNVGNGSEWKNITQKDVKKDSANVGLGMCLSDHYLGHQHHLLYAFFSKPHP